MLQAAFAEPGEEFNNVLMTYQSVLGAFEAAAGELCCCILSFPLTLRYTCVHAGKVCHANVSTTHK